MNDSRKLLLWIGCYILSFASLLLAFPIVLFALYPYSVIIIAGYAVSVVVLSVLSFRKNAIEHTTIKRVLFGMLLVPVIVLLISLVSIEMGWLHYPG